MNELLSVGEHIIINHLGDMSQAELASRVGTTPASISRVLTGRSTISTKMALRISRVLKCDPLDLLKVQSIYLIKQEEMRRGK